MEEKKQHALIKEIEQTIKDLTKKRGRSDPNDPGDRKPETVSDSPPDNKTGTKANVTLTRETKGDWPDPVPLSDHYIDNDFPAEYLPKVIRDMVLAVSEAKQVDPSLTAAIALGVLSSCWQKRARIKIMENYVEPVNLFVCPILDSGERKSAVFSEITQPLYDMQKELEISMEQVVGKNRAEKKFIENDLRALYTQETKEKDPDQKEALRQEARDREGELEQFRDVTSPVYVADDVTTEKLGDLMADNGEKISVFSAEGGHFLYHPGALQS